MNESILLNGVVRNYKIYDSSNRVVRDFVPSIRNEDGKAGFYDVVSKRFYTSPVGDDFKCGKKIGHHFDEGRIATSPSHMLDGEMVYTCSICGREVHEKINRTAFKVEFKVPSYVQNIKIFSEIDPTKYEYSLIGYTRNINTFNYSKSGACIYFEVMYDGQHDFDITVSNGELVHIEGNKYKVINIIHDCVVEIINK